MEKRDICVASRDASSRYWKNGFSTYWTCLIELSSNPYYLIQASVHGLENSRERHADAVSPLNREKTLCPVFPLQTSPRAGALIAPAFRYDNGLSHLAASSRQP